MKMYKVTDINQLAALFETRASDAEIMAKRTPLKTDQKLFHREMVIWRQAASIIRDTEIVK